MDTRILHGNEMAELSGGYSLDGLLTTYDFITLFSCLSLCLENFKCLGIFHHETILKCILSENVFFTKKTFIEESGWHHYRTSGDDKCEVWKHYIHNRDLGLCYMPKLDAKDQAQAETFCKAAAGNLVKVDTQTKQNHLEKTLKSIPVSNDTVDTFTCWHESGAMAPGTALPYHDPLMTVTKCRNYCIRLGGNAKYFYIQQQKCRCVWERKLPHSSYIHPLDNCTFQCPGDLTQICGDANSTSGLGSLYPMNVQLVENPDFYIGLSKDSIIWKWEDNQVAQFTAFNDSSSGSCAVMSSAHSYNWRSVSCSERFSFICEVDLN